MSTPARDNVSLLCLSLLSGFIQLQECPARSKISCVEQSPQCFPLMVSHSPVSLRSVPIPRQTTNNTNTAFPGCFIKLSYCQRSSVSCQVRERRSLMHTVMCPCFVLSGECVCVGSELARCVHYFSSWARRGRANTLVEADGFNAALS